jgi:hypothetical protein
VTVAPAATAPQAAAPQRADQPRKAPVAREKQQKKVWKVTTPENGNEKDTRGKEHKQK